MISSRNKLIASIIKKKLYEEVDQILAISRQGFDVFAQVEFPEVKSLLIQLLEQEVKLNSRVFRIIDYNESSFIEKRETLFDDTKVLEEEDEQFIPTVLVGEHKFDAGYGLVHYFVKSPDQLIGNVATAIETILNHFGLDLYIDVFDAKKLSRLKQIARIQGMCSLIDAVVQTAYYGGYKGDSASAQSYLDRAEFLTDAVKTEEEIPLENCARKFLSHVVTHGEDAHSFLKSCLSYFVVSKQGHTMTRASQILSISRTTLQEHLKIANQLGVSSFLDGGSFKSLK